MTTPVGGGRTSSTTVIGIAVGAVLAFAGLRYGFWGFLLVALMMALGGFFARVLDGSVDLGSLVDVLRGRSRGSS